MDVKNGDIITIKRLEDIDPLDFGQPASFERNMDGKLTEYYGFTEEKLNFLSRGEHKVRDVISLGSRVLFRIETPGWSNWNFTLNMVASNLTYECEEIDADQFEADIPAIFALI